ncbi:hypothetical protein GCM10025867_24170 [Frondihabitans sucicola]|uniref:LysM domain-containing protein n=1 Tax=Frondihabitans sucicola TaxID=1268041 RepID=A0ABN6Y2J5_9MICO|nr:LysM peptidoglycan-binding domain-containing protein [Frondihabitans sucicola]BDZ50176.1 hypothetical protein GCM10025867_24170 [Frondihabitans sucicola]
MSATITAFPRSAGTHGILPAEAVRPVTPARPAEHAHLHITRRGRVVLTAAVVVAVLATVLGFVLSGGGAVATSTSGHVQFQHVTVSAGETLWGVAEDVAPNADPRDVIADIQQLNNLGSTEVMPGQSLAIPTKYTQK